ncbi:LysR family transcriptional regulator [Pseudomonas sp. LTJR-52]|uniref:LysR family transcriptional regulator n=1 Tax=Pseudomonas sp. LTJR-52 TaxID=2479392 RepID=UPI000EFB9413|nr:LysR family transcriptional regulator [Pseudomonas sp. LTJR-52]AYN97030.1 LysR family transcriptional regulator [Pseudomonas sp. LTJR-52]
MITLKQLEAIFWIVELGSFEAASVKLNMSQSAVSKRVQELEDTFDVRLFDRSKRTAKLTEKGEDLFEYAVEMLRQRDCLLESISSKAALVKRYRLGVTELTALTWLPALVEEIRLAYPKVALEPSIELSSELFKKLENNQIDLIIVPDIFADPRYVIKPLKSVKNVWMTAPGLYKGEEFMSLQSLAFYTVLTQGGSSGTGLIYERWLAENQVRLNRTLTSNYLIAQVGLTISGVGISYLPYECLKPLISQDRLKVIETRPALPEIQYTAVHRADRFQGLSLAISRLAEQCCDFSRLILEP